MSQNNNIDTLICGFNQLTSLDLSLNNLLKSLNCSYNNLSSLDVSQNIALTYLYCSDNNLLTNLDLRNGNNINFTYFEANNNDSLYCISVDDSAWSTNNWTNIDSHTNFSNDCNPSTIGIIEIEKNLLAYPNPTNDIVTISVNNFNGNIKTDVYDLIGNRLQTTKQTRISLRDFAKGIYILKVAYSDRVEEVKVIKE